MKTRLGGREADDGAEESDGVAAAERSGKKAERSAARRSRRTTSGRRRSRERGGVARDMERRSEKWERRKAEGGRRKAKGGRREAEGGGREAKSGNGGALRGWGAGTVNGRGETLNAQVRRVRPEANCRRADLRHHGAGDCVAGMPEPFTLTGLSVLGGYVGTFVGDVVYSLCKKSGEEELKGFAGKLAKRLKEGEIARNHDLEGALVTSLRETFFAFGHACREEDCRYDATGRAAWLAPVIARLTDAAQLKAALEEALPVHDGRDPAPREAARLGAPTLAPAFVQPPLVAAVGRAIAAVHGNDAKTHRAWLTGRAEGTWTARREDGALVPNVTLAEVFAYSFREKINTGPRWRGC